MNNLLLSATHNLNLSILKPYIDSLESCGYMGDKIMFMYNSDDEVSNYLNSKGWVVYFRETKTKVHMDRFFDMYSILEETKKQYDYVITTDCRDVIFQTNPIDYLNKNLKNKLLISGENHLYKDEIWNGQNLIDGFKHEIYLKKHLNCLVCNVGIIAGRQNEMKDLLLFIYLISQSGNLETYTDQSSFNLIVHNELIKDKIQIETKETNWALQAATLYSNYEIKIKNNLIMCGDEPFVIIHQYDRNKTIVEFFKKIYNEY